MISHIWCIFKSDRCTLQFAEQAAEMFTSWSSMSDSVPEWRMFYEFITEHMPKINWQQLVEAIIPAYTFFLLFAALSWVLWTVFNTIHDFITLPSRHSQDILVLYQMIEELKLKWGGSGDMDELHQLKVEVQNLERQLRMNATNASAEPEKVLMGPPPPPPLPSMLVSNVDPLEALKIRKNAQKIEKAVSQDPNQPSMSDVLRELSQVQRKVITLMQSPRASYLDKKKSLPLSSLHRQLMINNAAQAEENVVRESKRTR